MLSVSMADMGRVAGSILLVCLISFTNANTSPEIHNVVERVREDIPEGGYAFTISASDADNDALVYELNGPNAMYFSVTRNTGVVNVRMKLDRESNTVMILGVIVSDPHNRTPKDLTIILIDANDNKPIFQQSSYDVDVSENAPVGQVLFQVTAVDADTSLASLVKYSIQEVIPHDGINLFSIMESSGEVTLQSSLNYTALSTFYRLKINASDGGGEYMGEHVVQSSIAFAFITVLDVPDLDPQFLSLPYTTRVEEGLPVNQSVFRVTAIDQDTGVNDVILYSIEHSTIRDLFYISENDGVIYIKSDIDREVTGDAVTLTVKATEANRNIHGIQASTTANVEITIIDINDNKPEFYMCGGTEEVPSCVRENTFTGEIFEHSLGTVPINMTVKDMDKAGEIQLTLAGPDMEVFSVAPLFAISESTVQLVVKWPQKLDFEDKKLMVVQVIATDKEELTFHSTATVTIKIKDINDNSPIFPHDSYKLQVPEHCRAGTIFANITAEDLDELDIGKITYRLLPESILNYFDVELDTGAVYVKNSTLIDREVRSLYSVTLQARDSDNNTGTTVLEIMLTDINDQAPVINRDSYVVYVEEGGKIELQIQATDADDPKTGNGQIVFGIMSSRYSDNFTIDPNTGMLRNNVKLDREALDPKLNGKIELNVTATDKGIPAKSTSVPVIINVEDINDNTPEFKATSYKFSVKEGEKGAFVGSVQAEDLDQTIDFNRISFSIKNGSFGSFIIRTFVEVGGYRGNITVDPDIELDYESVRKSFTLWVEAADLEQKNAVVMVEVEVLDVNDERPEFKPEFVRLDVKENTIGVVGNFMAVDKDGNHSLVYELESIQCQCNKTLKPCNWFILEPTGDVTVNPENTVDYELCDQVVMEAQVVDKYTQKGENNSVTSGRMVIDIVDTNDNAPAFIVSGSVFVVVSESASKGTTVAEVTATDADSETNRKIKFEVTKVQFNHTNGDPVTMRTIFKAVDSQKDGFYVGIIQSTEELDTRLKGKYLVTVVATDAGGLSTSTVQEIFTIDESFKIELRFVSPLAEVTKNYNSIIRALTVATKADVEVVDIREDTAESRASGVTIIEAYFVNINGTAISSDAVEKQLSDPEHFLILSQFGLSYIGAVAVEDPEQDPLTYILLGLVGGLIIVLAVLTTSLMCTRRSYRTKLKAAKAMNSAAMVANENQKSGPVVPGTNKYTMEGANPVLNLNIDTATDLGFDEESSNADRLSLNSLDYNVDMTMPERDMMSMRIIQEEDEDSGAPEHIEPLGAALAQRGMKNKKKGSSVHPTFSNPAFSTTDL